jgi:hypothetical protein
MRFPRRQHENPTGHEFCGKCGAALNQVDARRRTAYTPKHLGEILTSTDTLEGEREQVTVLSPTSKARWSCSRT